MNFIHYHFQITTLEHRRNWKISVYGREHGVPHVHVTGPEFRAVMEIATGVVLAGTLPAAVLIEARQWLAAYRSHALEHWQAHNLRFVRNPMLKITDVIPLHDHRVQVVLSNGKRLDLSVAAYLDAPGYASLRDPSVFAHVRVEEWGHGIEWPGDLGIPLSALVRLDREQAGRAYPVSAFNAWMQRHGLSAAAAARALGLTRRTIVYYHTGQKPIPLVVGLACEGVDARLKQAA